MIQQRWGSGMTLTRYALVRGWERDHVGWALAVTSLWRISCSSKRFDTIKKSDTLESFKKNKQNIHVRENHAHIPCQWLNQESVKTMDKGGITSRKTHWTKLHEKKKKIEKLIDNYTGTHTRRYRILIKVEAAIMLSHNTLDNNSHDKQKKQSCTPKIHCSCEM